MMRILGEAPPNSELVYAAFPLCEERKAVFCYGDTIYNPFRSELMPDVIYHESVHSRQQGADPEGWWKRYVLDQDFRISQEVEAYAAQHDFVNRHVTDRNALYMALREFATALSSGLYGTVVTYEKAKSLIRGAKRVK